MNAGPQLLQLYTQWKTSLPFALSQPAPAALSTLANDSASQGNWEAAMDVAHDLDALQPARARGCMRSLGRHAKVKWQHVLALCCPAVAAGS